MKNDKSFIPKHGGYTKLRSYIQARFIYDATVYFTKRFFTKFDRTVDQMIQAARSGKQNIAEGSINSATSKKSEIRLTSVARGSLEELLVDYYDFARTHNLKLWSETHPYAIRLRELCSDKTNDYESFRPGIENEDPEICVNVIIGLTKATCYLIDRQIKSLEQDFIKNGGISEKMYQARKSNRGDN